MISDRSGKETKLISLLFLLDQSFLYKLISLMHTQAIEKENNNTVLFSSKSTATEQVVVKLKM